jgi:hypothetical protein
VRDAAIIGCRVAVSSGTRVVRPPAKLYQPHFSSCRPRQLTVVAFNQ